MASGKRYSSRSRSTSGFGIAPLLLVALVALAAWKVHGGPIPGLEQLRSLFR